MQKEILDLTKSLVGIKSVNGTAGERKVADYIYAYFSDMPYFKAHPENLFFQPIPDDPLERGSVVAVVEGIAKDTAEAVPGPSVAIPDDHPDRTESSAWRRDENPKAVKSLYKRTLLLHGHIDTVGTEDFGPLEQFCTDPDMLYEKMKEMELPQEVRADLESGDYMFGRGSVD
jgi:arginine utilization protein RocB